MLEKIKEPVSVNFISDVSSHRVYPYIIRWRERIYKIKQIGLHHQERVGKTLFHIFSVTDGNLFFRLKLNTETLSWNLEEIADGLSNLEENQLAQLTLWENETKKRQLTSALDDINCRFGDFSIIPARMMGLEDKIIDRIAFGH